MTEWIDVTVPIRHGMVHWPDNPPIVVERVMDQARGNVANVSKISLGVHTGTHVDAPIHFDSDAKGVETVPLDALFGAARVVAIKDKKQVTVAELQDANVKAGERILLKTRNSRAAWKKSPVFVKDAVHISVEAAHWLASRKVMTVGIDYLSVGGFTAKNGPEIHETLIAAGVWIIEGLDLTNAPEGPCDLICLPIKIAGSDGAPARALVRPKKRPGRGSAW